ncbi:MAG: glycosyltransferase family 4 protein [Candidatus Buchananbacteria bacterium]|nr:glycosyltransferase family 4 protein [Candidatus Buchananbacteria bacterium]
MKIAILTSTFPPYAGGIGNVAAANALELVKLGHQVTIFTPEYQKVTEEVHNLSIKRIKPLFKYGNAAFLPGIVKLLKGYEIIHLHYPFFGVAEVLWLKNKKLKKSGSKIIIHYHMDVVGSGFLKKVFSFHTKFILPKIINTADRVIVTSNDYAQNSNLKDLLAKNPAKFVAVPNGVDINFFKPENKDAELLNKNEINLEDKVVVFVGGLDSAHYFKGIEYLIEAMSFLRQADYKWKLVIVGEGDLKKNYQDLAGQLHVDDKIKFAGYVPNHQLPKYYNLADVVVLPSIDKSEAFGLALVEGMACAKPAVASNLPGVRSVVEDRVSGLLIEPKDSKDLAAKINYLLTNPTVAKEFGQAGRQLVEQKYSWQKIGLELDELYKSLD